MILKIIRKCVQQQLEANDFKIEKHIYYGFGKNTDEPCFTQCNPSLGYPHLDFQRATHSGWGGISFIEDRCIIMIYGMKYIEFQYADPNFPDNLVTRLITLREELVTRTAEIEARKVKVNDKYHPNPLTCPSVCEIQAHEE